MCIRDSVEAVAYMEDSGSFNAGLGSILSINGIREMDAGVMDGYSMRIGAVAATRYPKNPVRLAKVILEKTDHVILAGSGADFLAERMGLEKMPPPSNDIIRRYNELIEKYKKGEITYFKGNIELAKELGLLDTVGAVALDQDGRLASAVSTGGVWLKLPGRVGDSPIPGAGFWADDLVAVAATGLGEVIIRSMPSIRLSILVHQGYSISKSGELILDYVTRMCGLNTIGFIAVDRNGEEYIGFNTEHMMIAYGSFDKKYAKLLSRQ